MTDFGKILDHPASREILSKLLSGVMPKEVSQWLKIKYPDKAQAHLRLSQKILKEFNESQYTNVYDQFKKDLVTLNNDDDNDKVVSASLLNNKTYRNRLQEIADKEFNILTVLDNLIVITHERMEQVFDRIQEKPGDFKGDRVLLQYINTMFDISEKLEKIRLNAPDNISQNNITMQAFDDYMTIFRDTIRETLAEVDPDTAMLFMDKLYNKLNSLKPPQPITQSERLHEATILQERVAGVIKENNNNS